MKKCHELWATRCDICADLPYWQLRAPKRLRGYFNIHSRGVSSYRNLHENMVGFYAVSGNDCVMMITVV
jgi:hypothetical protein